MMMIGFYLVEGDLNTFRVVPTFYEREASEVATR